MYEYKFVKVKLSRWNNAPKENYHEIIASHAKDGWRFVQLFAPVTSGNGYSSFFEIIFEKSLNN
ncbi:hypothetical protein AM500_04625 [Bacillus sp. FJAT-18017]|uniref:DUF4177 domain-containing protein n=1 Tax=Bacillus sp. FJAT-18017 TaxID=1705566 RepID=UPI0006AE1425|nr:DUF4177 domain-containing protein [Bacillus sp. FJAT-18017]ALC89154.1 hypothetical protein AM500_04625 [Bacillus sp. FJAT-18017]